jgi:hypothetical protein
MALARRNGRAGDPFRDLRKIGPENIVALLKVTSSTRNSALAADRGTDDWRNDSRRLF